MKKFAAGGYAEPFDSGLVTVGACGPDQFRVEFTPSDLGSIMEIFAY